MVPIGHAVKWALEMDLARVNLGPSGGQSATAQVKRFLHSKMLSLPSETYLESLVLRQGDGSQIHMLP